MRQRRCICHIKGATVSSMGQATGIHIFSRVGPLNTTAQSWQASWSGQNNTASHCVPKLVSSCFHNAGECLSSCVQIPFQSWLQHAMGRVVRKGWHALALSATVQVWFECVSETHMLAACWPSGVMLTGGETYKRWGRREGITALGDLSSKRINMVLFVGYYIKNKPGP